MTHRLEDPVKETAIVDFITTASEITAGKVGWEMPTSTNDDNQKQISQPFIILGIINGPDLISSGKKFKTTDIWTWKYHYQFTVSIKSFAKEGHLNFLTKIIQGRKLEQTKKILRLANLGILSNTAILDISKPANTTFDRIGTFDMVFTYATERDETVSQFDTVKIGLALDNRDTNNITVP
jgi:hypothetical protein